MVTGEHDVGVFEVEADVPGCVAGGVDGAQPAAGEGDQFVVDDNAVGSRTRARGRLGGRRLLERRYLLRAGPGTHHVEALKLQPLVAATRRHVREQFVVRFVHRDPRTRRLPHPSAQPGVVGMEVGEDDALHVLHRVADLLQPGGEPGPGVVVVPTGVDEDQPTRGFHRVDQCVTEGVVRNRDRYLEDAITDGRRTIHLLYLALETALGFRNQIGLSLLHSRCGPVAKSRVPFSGRSDCRTVSP